MNYILKLGENMYNLQNYNIFQTGNPRSLKHGLDAIPYHVSKFWQQVPIDIREVTSLVLFKNRIQTWKSEDYPGRSSKTSIPNVRV